VASTPTSLQGAPDDLPLRPEQRDQELHLEVVAVFGNERLTILREPALGENPITALQETPFDDEEYGEKFPTREEPDDDDLDEDQDS
jgi:hypothetical protein